MVTTDRLDLWLAILTLVSVVTVLILARSAARRKAVWRISEVARELGLEEEAADDPTFQPWLAPRWSQIADLERTIVWVLRGTYEDRDLFLLGIHERSSRAGSRRPNDDRGQWIDRIVRLRNRRPGVPKVANQLLVLLTEALPGLPDFRIGQELASPRGAGSRQRLSPVQIVLNQPTSVLFDGLTIEPPRALGDLPQSFLDRAARVLVGRRQPWSIEGLSERLSVRIAQWRSSSRVRSYRAVLDDALSLRAAWDVRTDRSDDANTHRSIRSALERIRQASEPSESEGTPMGDDRV
ncbi:hypothetical protein [Tautonia rosea]|uniref:hypothetical protein n=1 Tax=Tautonia rosea TaxID=2728037 RepID=UPI001472B11D|nr:hypothetical protein [Tautonia rosea]